MGRELANHVGGAAPGQLILGRVQRGNIVVLPALTGRHLIVSPASDPVVPMVRGALRLQRELGENRLELELLNDVVGVAHLSDVSVRRLAAQVFCRHMIRALAMLTGGAP
jgi:hypothetical protein